MVDNSANQLTTLPMHPAFAFITAVAAFGPMLVMPSLFYRIFVSGIPKVCYELPFWVWPALSLTVAVTSAAMLAAVYFLPAAVVVSLACPISIMGQAYVRSVLNPGKTKLGLSAWVSIGVVSIGCLFITVSEYQWATSVHQIHGYLNLESTATQNAEVYDASIAKLSFGFFFVCLYSVFGVGFYYIDDELTKTHKMDPDFLSMAQLTLSAIPFLIAWVFSPYTIGETVYTIVETSKYIPWLTTSATVDRFLCARAIAVSSATFAQMLRSLTMVVTWVLGSLVYKFYSQEYGDPISGTAGDLRAIGMFSILGGLFIFLGRDNGYFGLLDFFSGNSYYPLASEDSELFEMELEGGGGVVN